MNTGSVNIPVFAVAVLVDLISKPKFVISNKSTGAQTGIKVAFSALSPLGLPVKEGDINTPDVTGKWTSFEITDLPAHNGQVEWGTYTILATLKDGAKEVTLTIPVPVAQPAGNKQGDNYGKGILNYEVRCNSGKIYVEDNTGHSYLGLAGTLVARKFTLAYPPDSTGVAPTLKTSNVQNSTFDIPFNSEGYTVLLEAIYDYAVTPDATVRIKYKASDCFEVACNIDLCKIICAANDFREKVVCNPNQTANILKLVNVNTLLNLVLVAKSQPNCGVNVDSLLRELGDLLNIDCYCSEGSGIGNDRDSIKSLAIQIYNLTKEDKEVKDYFCLLDCGCPEIIGVGGTISTTVPGTTLPATTLPTTLAGGQVADVSVPAETEPLPPNLEASEV